MRFVNMLDEELLALAEKESWVGKPRSFWADLCTYTYLPNAFLEAYKDYVCWDYVLELRPDIPDYLLDELLTKILQLVALPKTKMSNISQKTLEHLIKTQNLSTTFIDKWYAKLPEFYLEDLVKSQNLTASQQEKFMRNCGIYPSNFSCFLQYQNPAESLLDKYWDVVVARQFTGIVYREYRGLSLDFIKQHLPVTLLDWQAVYLYQTLNVEFLEQYLPQTKECWSYVSHWQPLTTDFIVKYRDLLDIRNLKDRLTKQKGTVKLDISDTDRVKLLILLS